MSSSLLDRLKRRKLVQWTVAYLAAAWLVLQVLDLLAQPFGWPDLVLRAATALFGVGLLGCLVLAWFHGEKGAQRVGRVEFLMLSAILVIAALSVASVTGPSDHPGSGAAAPTGLEQTVEQLSVGVLPFANISGDSTQEYFSDGLTEELLNALSQLPSLRVASRASSFSFKGRNIPVDSVGRALRVAHVLEGSVRRTPNGVRIGAQLTDVRSGYQLWSDSYDRRLEDILSVQTEISRDIARALSIQLVERTEGSAAAASIDPAAYDAYLRGLYFLRNADYRAALPYLEQAVRRAPSFALAWAELSDAHNQLGRRDEARAAALRAIHTDSTLAEAHGAMAYIHFFYDRDWPAAERRFERALALKPGYVQVVQRRAYAYLALGRAAEAVGEIERAGTLDPLSLRIAIDRALIYFYARRFEQAEAQFRHLLVADSASGTGPWGLGQIALLRGDTAEAAQWFARGGSTLLAALASADTAGALALLAPIESAGTSGNPLGMAQAYTLLGRPDDAFRWLTRGLEERDRLITLAAIDPRLDMLRDDPRMARFLERLGPEWAGMARPR
ncbi:MAG: tetratricopeptide repeat protein [Gemmatimonadota bacterium]